MSSIKKLLLILMGCYLFFISDGLKPVYENTAAAVALNLFGLALFAIALVEIENAGSRNFYISITTHSDLPFDIVSVIFQENKYPRKIDPLSNLENLSQIRHYLFDKLFREGCRLVACDNITTHFQEKTYCTHTYFFEAPANCSAENIFKKISQ